jgi:leader peptidase (prepilin peptidase)/N-methyltransferase
MGWQVLPATILISSLLGTLIGFTMIIFKKRNSQTPIPFGPYLAAAGWISLMWGEGIVKTFNSFYLF